MATVDNLQIQINAQAVKANEAIDRLVTKLDTLTTSLNKLDGSKLTGLANGVQRLGNAMQTMNNIKTKDFTRIAKGLEEFSKIDASGLSSTSSGLNTLARSLSTLSNIQNIGNITPAINAIKNLARVDMSGFDTTKMQTIANTMSDFATKLSSVGKIESSVTRVVSSMARLANSGQYISNVATYFPQLGNQVVSLVRKLSSAGAIDPSITKIVEGIAKLASAGKKIEATVANLDKLGDGVINLLNRLKNAPQINSNIANTIQGLGNLAFSGSRISTVSNTAAGSTKKLGNALISLKDNFSKANKSFKSFSNNIGMLYIKILSLTRIFKKFGKIIESSMDYVEVLNYFNAAFGQVADKANLSQWQELGYSSAEEYYNSFAKRAEEITQKMTGFKVTDTGMLENTGIKNLGMNPSQIMDYQAMFGQMASSMGVASENALTMSEVMTKLGADLASVKNMDFNKTWTDMASGMAGMSRTMDKYGVNIRNVNLQQKLNELGIKANISALNQNDKAMLRNIITLESTKYAWGDMARTIEQPANQLRLIKSNFANLSRTIGNIFLPIVAKVLPYINALLIALQRLAEEIVKMLGFKDFEWGGIGGNKENDALSNIYDDADNATDSIEDTTDAVKELKNELMGFDKINKLSDTTDTDKNDNKSGLSAEDSSALSDAFNKIASDYLKVWNDAFDKVNSKAQETADKIIKAFKSGDFKGIGSYIGKQLAKQLKKIPWKTQVYPAAKKFGSGLADFLNGLISPELFSEVGKTIASSLNTMLHFLDSFGTTFDWKNFGDSIAAGVNGFFKTFDFNLLANTFNTWANGILDGMIAAIDGIEWDDISQKIADLIGAIDTEGITWRVGKLVNSLANAFYTLVSKKETWTNLGTKIADGINGFFKGMDEVDKETGLTGWQALGKSISTTISGIETTLTTALEKTDWVSVGQGIADFISSIEWGKVAWNLFKLANSLIAAIIEAIVGFSTKDPFSASIIALFAAMKLTKLGTIVKSTINGYFTTHPEIFKFSKKLSISLAIASVSIQLAKNALEKIGWNDYDFEEIKEASEKMFEDWFGKNPLSVSLADTFLIVSDTIIDPNDVIEGLKLLWKDVCDGDFKFNLGNLIEFPSYNEISDALQDIFYDIDNGDFELSIFKPEWTLPSFNDFKTAWDLFTKDVKNGDFELSIFKPEWTLPSFNDFKTAWDLFTKDVKNGDFEFSLPFGITLPSINEIKKGFSERAKHWKDKIVSFKIKITEKVSSIRDWWSERAGEWKDKAVGFGINILNTVSSIRDWWSERAGEWKDKAVGFGINILNTVSSIRDWWSERAGEWKDKAVGFTINAITKVEDIKNAFKTAINTVIGWINTYIIDNLNKISIEIPEIEILGKKVFDGKKIGFNLPDIKAFAVGGFPEEGPFFMNRGEIAGKFSNGKSVVANNQQITQGIADAVYPAVYNAVSAAINNSKNNQNVNIVLEGDAKGLFKAVKTEADTYTMLTGQSAFNL